MIQAKRSNVERGFTLLEVLATLVIIGIVLPAAMKGISLSIAAGALAKSNVEAASLADSKLKELVATNAWQGQASSGDFGSDWPDYRWTSMALNRDEGLIEVDVEVVWIRRGLERSVVVSTLVYGGTQQ